MGDFEFDSNGNVDSLKFGSGDNDMNAFINEHYNTKGYASTHGEIIENLKMEQYTWLPQEIIM